MFQVYWVNHAAPKPSDLNFVGLVSDVPLHLIKRRHYRLLSLGCRHLLQLCVNSPSADVFLPELCFPGLFPDPFSGSFFREPCPDGESAEGATGYVIGSGLGRVVDARRLIVWRTLQVVAQGLNGRSAVSHASGCVWKKKGACSAFAIDSSRCSQ